MASEGRATPTALTRAILLVGAALTGAVALLIVDGHPRVAGCVGAAAAVLLLLGGHRANHGAGGRPDRMLDALLDRVWDGAVLGSLAWASRGHAPATSGIALVALAASFLSSYVRARGAALDYSVEESHITRGMRYGLVVLGLVSRHVFWPVFASAAVSVLAVAVRTSQVAKEERV